MTANEPCLYCGKPHTGVCPLVRACEYHSSGVLKRVEFHADASSGNGNGTRSLLLDTSVIIDGRIIDISHTGFIERTMLIPRFVLTEIQSLADSGDDLRRARGRHGLEMLRRFQEEAGDLLHISDEDARGVQGVDDKLVQVARRLHCPIVTNDYNLNRVATLQGVDVLNVNELANAVKTVLLPGESLTIEIVHVGKEPGQGVGYLDDGVMIVVQDGADRTGQETEVVVTKVLQTAAGRMLFARLGN